MSFKLRDIVNHVLGGPKMQVVTVHSEKLVECFWLDDFGAPHQKGFLVVDLIAAPTPQRQAGTVEQLSGPQYQEIANAKGEAPAELDELMD
jgi:uncharacterized protein YodC (DUF2158 family)